MTKLKLTMCVGDYPYTRAILNRSVTSDRLDIEFYPNKPLTGAFREMICGDQIDAGEMAIVTHVLAHRFNKGLTGLAIPLWSRHPHSNLVCADKSFITGPKDLVGNTVGVRSYAQTSGVWVRGVLRDEYGVDHRDIEWRTFEDAHLAEYADPPYSFRNDDGKTIREALLSGECSAIMGERIVSAEDVRPVIADPDQVASQWVSRTLTFPINHVLSVRTELIGQHPWLVSELMRLFNEARDLALTEGEECPPRYGLDHHLGSIETLIRYCYEQDVIEERYEASDLFAQDS